MEHVAKTRSRSYFDQHRRSPLAKMYTRSEIVQMLQAAGFRDLRYQKVSPFSFLCIARKPQP